MRLRGRTIPSDFTGEQAGSEIGVNELGQSRAVDGVQAPRGGRVRLDGKFFRLDERKFWVKGVTYGPFEPRVELDGAALPPPDLLDADLRQMSELGANTIRVYHVPPRGFLDAAHEHGLKVFVDVPWSKHRCFLESAEDQASGRRAVLEAARRCKGHPALFALSVANEVPADVVRWLGHEPVERFIDELVDIVHQEDPDALATFASFPPTEYLHPMAVDFYTMNVYLHKRDRFRAYLQRLQNLADEKPLLLGEYGIDSMRNGEGEQAELLAMHVEEVYANGLAGTCCFSFTDEWFTGGHPIEDWAFGLVRADRSPKPAFERVKAAYRAPSPLPPLLKTPKVSVVVCTYDGSKTLDGCLTSLEALTYPDYEVVLIDDGSRDSVPEIAARHPFARYHRQENRGLSVARNVGMDLAKGEIIAYTDDDCFADPDWLYYLVAKLLETGATGVGGPNLLPAEDGPVAACVSASPGAPAHVLLDDALAEHVPGCNMAFWADRLRAIGGFDPVYTKAGDDVDVCWRMHDEGDRIVFAPAAMVWHHRRSTVKAYLKQQRGYGEAEGLLKRKHPEKFRGFRDDLSWMGRIYTHAGLGLKVGGPIVHHGVFGAGQFQAIYGATQIWWPLVVLSLEWWVLGLAMLGLAPIVNPAAMLARSGILGGFALSPADNPLFLLPALMLAATGVVAFLVAGQAQPPARQRRFWSRFLIAAMHVAQPVVRGWARYRTRFETIRIPEAIHTLRRAWKKRAGHLLGHPQLDLWSEERVSRDKLLESLLRLTAQRRWFVHVDPGWESHDVRFYGDRWCQTDLVSVTEDHGGGRRLTRVRLLTRATFFQKVLWLALGYILVLSWGLAGPVALAVVPVLLFLLAAARASGRRLNDAVMSCVLSVAERLGMSVVNEPNAFLVPLEERVEASLSISAPVPGCPMTARSVSPLVCRAAGLHLETRTMTTP